MDIIWWVGIAITALTIVPVFMQLRSQPRGLVVLFFAEMWERFSYYGMRGLLIFYLTQHLLFDDKSATSQYGSYTSLIYLMPLVGGLLADRYLGTRRAVMFGAILLVAGHLTLAIEGPPARQVLEYRPPGSAQAMSFPILTEGRGSDRQARLEIADKLYGFAPEASGALRIEGLPGMAPIPALLPADQFEIKVAERNPLYLQIFYFALSLVIMGVAFLKPNISSLVGQLYPENDPRRDSGFTLYYYGINLGSFWAGLGCGWLGQNIGWWAGFGVAGLGMMLGLIMFILGRRSLGDKGLPPDLGLLKASVAGPLSREHIIYLCAIASVGLIMLVFGMDGAMRNLLTIGSVAVLGYLFWIMATKCDAQTRNKLTLALILILSSVVFWTLFEQAGSSLNLFAERSTDLRLTDTQTLSASQTQSFNPGFLLIGAPIFAALWAWLGQRNLDPHPAMKFALALILVGSSFLLLVFGTRFADDAFRIPLMFLLLAYMLQTFGELLLSPVGLSQMTRLAPPFLIATLMATWFLGMSWAQWLGGLLAGLASADTIGGQVLDPAKALETYAEVFARQGWVTVAIGVGLALATPLLARLTGKTRPDVED